MRAEEAYGAHMNSSINRQKAFFFLFVSPSFAFVFLISLSAYHVASHDYDQ